MWLTALFSHLPSPSFRSSFAKSASLSYTSLTRRPNASYSTMAATAITLFVILLILSAFTIRQVPSQLRTTSHSVLVPQQNLDSSSLVRAGSPTLRGTNVDLTHATECQNSVIFTGARQGSTWFIDSIERCAYSRVDPQSGRRLFHPDVFKKTEIWKHFGEPQLDGTDLSAQDALHYVVHNTSIKIFPSVFWRRRQDVTEILQNRQKYKLTILVLRRDVEATWHSWLRAQRSNVWNVASSNATSNVTLHTDVSNDADDFDLPAGLDSRELEHEKQRLISNWSPEEYRQRFTRFSDSRKRFDKGVEQLLREQQISYDVFDYDTAREMPVVIARNNRCIIRNCNFDREQQRAAMGKMSRWEAQEFSAYGQDLLEDASAGIQHAGAASAVLGS